MEPNPPKGLAILYVGARVPELSETFVYRELLNLRDRGHDVAVASIRKPRAFPRDASLTRLADEALILYSARTWFRLPLALAAYPRLLFRAIGDAASADHAGLPSRLKHVLHAAIGIAAGWRLRRRGIGHVHAHMANVPAMIGLYTARALDARFSFTGHAADLFVQRSALAFKLAQADFVSCISRWHRDFYRETTEIAAAKLPLIRCSVSLPATVADHRRREIVTVARLVAKKGVDLLLEAVAASKAVDWRLRILGDGPERGALETLAADLGIADRVSFEGAQPHSVCLDAISAAGLFVLPCRTTASGDKDGIPVVLMEAMAAARAVIAGKLPAIEELIENDISGVLVPGGDPSALAVAIDALIGDPSRRENLGRAAREKVATEFSDAINVERLEQAMQASAGSDIAAEPAERTATQGDLQNAR